jgi:hypothetical protein
VATQRKKYGMQKLPIFLTLGKALFSLLRNLPFFLVASIPFFVFHSYMVLLNAPLMRVAFVNSFLRPMGFNNGKSFEIQMLSADLVVPGPGFDFSATLTVALVLFELVVGCILAIIIQRRVLKQLGYPLEGFVASTRFFVYLGLTVLFLLLTAAVFFALPVLKPHIMQLAEMWYPANPSQIIALFNIILGSLACWILLKLGIALAATASGESQFNWDDILFMLGSDFWRTMILNLFMGVMFALMSVVLVPIGWTIFGGAIPTGFNWQFVIVLATILFQFWFQLVFTLIMVTHMYSHYRET